MYNITQVNTLIKKMSFLGGTEISLEGANALVRSNIAIVVLVLLIAYMFVVEPRLRKLEVATGLRKPSNDEGMSAVSVNGYASRLGQCRTDGTANDSNDACWAVPSNGKSGFLGGPEGPVFYDIGDVRATRGSRAQTAADAAEAAADSEVARATSLLDQALRMRVSSNNSQESIDAARSAAAARLAAAEAKLADLRAAHDAKMEGAGKTGPSYPDRLSAFSGGVEGAGLMDELY